MLPTVFDRRPGGEEVAIAAEAHTIGEDEAGWVFLHEAPLRDAGVTIPGFTETTDAPAQGQFRVYYTGWRASAIEFNAADHGNPITVAYTGRGSVVMAWWFNRIQSEAGNKTVSTSAPSGIPADGDEWIVVEP
jgi:hypothetical protein